MKTKNGLLKNGFKFTLFIGTMISLLGCQPDNPQPNPSGTVLTKWTMTINGQTQSWQGNFPESSNNNTGGSQYTYSNGNGQLAFVKDPSQAMFTAQIAKSGMNSTGTFTISSTNYSTSNAFFINDFSNGVFLTTQYGGNINVNIQSFPNQTASTDISSSTLVKGTFSGTVGSSSGALTNVTGSFESIRIN